MGIEENNLKIAIGVGQAVGGWMLDTLQRNSFYLEEGLPVYCHFCTGDVDEVGHSRRLGCISLLFEHEPCPLCGEAFELDDIDDNTKQVLVFQVPRGSAREFFKGAPARSGPDPGLSGIGEDDAGPDGF